MKDYTINMSNRGRELSEPPLPLYSQVKKDSKYWQGYSTYSNQCVVLLVGSKLVSVKMIIEIDIQNHQNEARPLLEDHIWLDSICCVNFYPTAR